jgi:hypothetical protein
MYNPGSTIKFSEAPEWFGLVCLLTSPEPQSRARLKPETMRVTFEEFSPTHDFFDYSGCPPQCWRGPPWTFFQPALAGSAFSASWLSLPFSCSSWSASLLESFNLLSVDMKSAVELNSSSLWAIASSCQRRQRRQRLRPLTLPRKWAKSLETVHGNVAGAGRLSRGVDRILLRSRNLPLPSGARTIRSCKGANDADSYF